MVVKYVEDFVGLDGRFYESKVASDCCSVRLVPDCGGMMSAIFLYRDNDQSMIIPFSARDLDKKMVYMDNNIFDIQVASGIVDLTGFKAVKLSKYIELNSVMKDVYPAIEFNDDSFEHLFKNMKEEF